MSSADEVELKPLLPCPFCGNPAYVEFIQWRKVHKIGCVKATQCSILPSITESIYEYAVTAWNRRVSIRPAIGKVTGITLDEFLKIAEEEITDIKIHTVNYMVQPQSMIVGSLLRRMYKRIKDKFTPAPSAELKPDAYALAEVLRDHRGGHQGFPPASWDKELAKFIIENMGSWANMTIRPTVTSGGRE